MDTKITQQCLYEFCITIEDEVKKNPVATNREPLKHYLGVFLCFEKRLRCAILAAPSAKGRTLQTERDALTSS